VIFLKGFKLDENGDVVVNKKGIGIVKDAELLKQTVKTVLGTNKNEWDFNKNEGIDFKKIIVKNPDIDVIKNEIQEGLKQVDDTFILTDFSFTQKGRTAFIKFSAVNSDEVTVDDILEY